jgi:hypothetical protein
MDSGKVGKTEMSLQYDLYLAHNALENRLKIIKQRPTEYWSGEITAKFRARVEMLYALFSVSVKF